MTPAPSLKKKGRKANATPRQQILAAGRCYLSGDLAQVLRDPTDPGLRVEIGRPEVHQDIYGAWISKTAAARLLKVRPDGVTVSAVSYAGGVFYRPKNPVLLSFKPFKPLAGSSASTASKP